MRRSLVLLLLFAAQPAFANDSPCSDPGYSGKPQNAKSCVNGKDSRTITCMTGFAVAGSNKSTVTLPGKARFLGCDLLDPCAAFGYSGKQQNVQECVNKTKDQRTITCMEKFIVSGTTGRTVTLTGAATFTGCIAPDIDMCKRYGYSGKPANVQSCANGPMERTIVCAPNFVVTGTTGNSIKLSGPAPFPGCSSTATKHCTRTGDGRKPGVRSCVDGPNTRTITCGAGFVVTGTTSATITLTGDAPFPGCTASTAPRTPTR